MLRGLELVKAKELARARAFFEAAAEFPLNLEAKKYYASGRSCEVFYHQGVIYEAAGELAKAREAFEKAVAERQYYHSYGAPHYYRGQANKKLGRSEEADPLFEALITRGTRELAEIQTGTGIGFSRSSATSQPTRSEGRRSLPRRARIPRAGGRARAKADSSGPPVSTSTTSGPRSCRLNSTDPPLRGLAASPAGPPSGRGAAARTRLVRPRAASAPRTPARRARSGAAA